VIDFHCHLDLYPNPNEVAQTCEEKGLYVLSVTTTPSAWRGTVALERGRIQTALGLHPQLAHERSAELDLFDQLLADTRYVGEIGLDGASEFERSRSEQAKVFDHILAACTSVGGRVLSIHSRRAARPVLERLAAHPRAGTPILHWFSGTKSELDEADRLGCWFSVGPPMVRGTKSRELVSRLPRERVLTESDGPFARIEGRPIYPWDADLAVRALADLWTCDEVEVRGLLEENLRALTTGAKGYGSDET